MKRKAMEKGFTLIELLIFMAIIVGVVVVISSFGLGLFNFSMFKMIFMMIKFNSVFYLTVALAIGWAVYNKIKHPEEFVWWEVMVQIVGSVVVIFASFNFFYYTSSDLADTEVWNHWTTKAKFAEPWTEEYDCSYNDCPSDKKKSCRRVHKTCRRHHSADYLLMVNNGDTISINSAQYRNVVNIFQNEVITDNRHYNQVSYGDGRTFETKFTGNIHQFIPAAIEHPYGNLVKASQTIVKKTGNAKGYEKFIMPYPRVQSGQFGKIELNRVLINGSATSDPNLVSWARQVDIEMDILAAKNGVNKEINPLIYIVPTSDKKFAYALEDAWILGKKNDAILILGITNFPKVEWAYVMSWTEVQGFKSGLRDNIITLDDITKQTTDDSDFKYEITKRFNDQIIKPVSEGGFQRKRMRDYNYVTTDMSLPIYDQVFIFLISGAFSYVISLLLKTNSIRNWSTARWKR